jgi:hypothetical protein
MKTKREWRAVHPQQPFLLTDDERTAKRLVNTWMREASEMKPGAFSEWVKAGISLSSREVGDWRNHNV